MTEETMKGERSSWSDCVAIGWRVSGQVSGHQQSTIHSVATLHDDRRYQLLDRRHRSRDDHILAEGTGDGSATHPLTAERSRRSYYLSELSLSRAIGQTAEEVREVSALLWTEMCISGEFGLGLSESKFLVRISSEIDPSWAQSLLYDVEDEVSVGRDVLVSRPIVSDESAILSFVLADSALVASADDWAVVAGGLQPKNGGHPYLDDSERRVSTDIGFCTIEVNLLSPDHPEMSEKNALHLIDPRRNFPVRERSVGVSFKIISFYIHPRYRRRGLGRLLAKVVKTFVAYTVDEIVEQVAYRDHIRVAQSREYNSSQQSSRRASARCSALDVIVSGKSVDHRSDRVFRTIVGEVLAEYGLDRLSPASPEVNEDASHLRSFALVCGKIISLNPDHAESAVLTDLLLRLGNTHSFHPRLERPSPWGSVATTVVDLVDWRSDR